MYLIHRNANSYFRGQRTANTTGPCEEGIIYMGTYQSGVDGQLFVWIDQQKYMADVSLQKREGGT